MSIHLATHSTPRISNDTRSVRKRTAAKATNPLGFCDCRSRRCDGFAALRPILIRNGGRRCAPLPRKEERRRNKSALQLYARGTNQHVTSDSLRKPRAPGSQSPRARRGALRIFETQKYMIKQLITGAAALTLTLAACNAQTSSTTTTVGATGTDTTTTTTESTGTITDYTPGSYMMLNTGTSTPVRYKFGKTVTYVTADGKVIESSRVRKDSKVRVHYMKDGDDMVVDKVIVTD